MAKIFTCCFSFLIISLLLVRISPTLVKNISLIAYEQFDCEAPEKFGEKDNQETYKSNIKNAEFISTAFTHCFKTAVATYNYRIFTPTILSLILEIPKRPPQQLS